MPDVADTAHMIFHAPYPLDRDATAASGIRPVRMRDAFAELGYRVWEVTGYSSQRRRAIAAVTEAQRAGVRFDFCYSESSTMPQTMTDPRHLPLHPRMDYAFFRRLRRSGIKVGHFLRDIYWRFPDYRRDVTFPKREAALLGYYWDFRNYARSLDVLYLPTQEMERHPPRLKGPAIRALPPGHGWRAPVGGPEAGVRLFYVGGIGYNYQLHKAVEAVGLAAARGADVALTICTVPEQWAARKHEYAAVLSDAVRITRGHGEEVAAMLREANVGLLCVEPRPYWEFVAPVKLFEYLGAGKPMLASRGTFAGDFVTSNGLGWSIDYDAEAIADWLVLAAGDPSVIARATSRLGSAWGEHTWRSRAQRVVDDLAPR